MVLSVCLKRQWGSTAVKFKDSNAGKAESVVKTGEISLHSSCSRTSDVIFRNTEERSVAEGIEIALKPIRIVRVLMLQKVRPERWRIRLCDRGTDSSVRFDFTT